ncbi:NrsF family protein [Dongia deserti]|uniref:NrsF family protein n=1 Tax=Dongia deserti TaxID=2268030 RepID=UPI0013C4AB95|nr:DUF1109 domain-containing protein [Dongia deserti]
MKTSQFIDLLSSDVQPVRRGIVGKALAVALVIGGVAAVILMLITVGLRPDVFQGAGSMLLLVKLLFTLSLVALGTLFLIAASYPGRNVRRRLAFLLLPFLAIASLGLGAILLATPMTRQDMIFGPEWLTCLMCIPLFAIAPFAALIWALRMAAPTDLRRTGAIAGLVAGALGATAYALHCPGDSIPFIAIWYGLPILLWTLLGAVLGPHLLRW